MGVSLNNDIFLNISTLEKIEKNFFVLPLKPNLEGITFQSNSINLTAFLPIIVYFCLLFSSLIKCSPY